MYTNSRHLKEFGYTINCAKKKLEIYEINLFSNQSLFLVSVFVFCHFSTSHTPKISVPLVHPRISAGELMYSSTLSLTLAFDGGWVVKAKPPERDPVPTL